jgi:hypothetical protein
MDAIASNAFLAKAINNTFSQGLSPVARVYPRLNVTLILDARTLLRLVLIA